MEYFQLNTSINIHGSLLNKPFETTKPPSWFSFYALGWRPPPHYYLRYHHSFANSIHEPYPNSIQPAIATCKKIHQLFWISNPKTYSVKSNQNLTENSQNANSQVKGPSHRYILLH